jgi:hypothetical protein
MLNHAAGAAVPVCWLGEGDEGAEQQQQQQQLMLLPLWVGVEQAVLMVGTGVSGISG